MPLDSQFPFLIDTTLGESSPTPLYYQLYKLLKQNIVNGTLDYGMQLPTELQLSKKFDVSRITAKRALDELAAEGLVARKRAKGTHVTHKYEPKPIKAPLIGMLQELEFMGQHSHAKVLDAATIHPPREIAAEFKLKNKEPLLQMTRVRSRGKEIFAYYTSWSKGLEKHIDTNMLESTTRLQIFKMNGIDIKRVKQMLSAEAASVEIAKALDVEPGYPLLTLIRRSFDKNENLVDYLHARYHPERFQYYMDLTPEGV
ncbi:GntR family transcriptional regulator [Glaciecola punicea]|jgi:GntR family transcriptional regulator|uniref:GntR family transcriptional regulator n=1 Tax=Glaciecola punicea TaxID=56804 RepID=UPI0008733D46|nr:GntR family transcriptional regulator [Glaciecola punicea]OFA29859.1 GntR family transcriptional regulator [Glaciecola punicea]